MQIPMFDPTPVEHVRLLPFKDRVERAIILLQTNEPLEGYYLAFSGGKDSIVCKELLELSGCKYDAWYNNTTIDPPELIRYIKEYHADVKWNNPKHGNMMHRVASAPKIPPTRFARWCCQEYKEGGGQGRTKIFGVRQDESKARETRWNEITVDAYSNTAICPIVYWTEAQVWQFIEVYRLPYCKLYDEGFSRLGCVGCPLASSKNQDREFERYPNYERNWKRSIIKNWEKWKDVPNTRTGEPRFHARFKTGEDFWLWWRYNRQPDYIRGDCQPMLLWTNEPGIGDDVDNIFYKQAWEAVMRLHDDKSITKEEAVEYLKRLVEEINILIEGLCF